MKSKSKTPKGGSKVGAPVKEPKGMKKMKKGKK